jgi:hypothetical protein
MLDPRSHEVSPRQTPIDTARVAENQNCRIPIAMERTMDSNANQEFIRNCLHV